MQKDNYRPRQICYLHGDDDSDDVTDWIFSLASIPLHLNKKSTFLKIANGLRYFHLTLLISHFCLPRKFFQGRRSKEIIGELTKSIFEKLRMFFKILESRYIVKQCVIYKYGWLCWKFTSFYRSALRAGGVLSSPVQAGGREDGCQTCGTNISVTTGPIFSVWSSVQLSSPVHCYDHLPICSIWACPWTKNVSRLPQIASRHCGAHISESAEWIYDT